MSKRVHGLAFVNVICSGSAEFLHVYVILYIDASPMTLQRISERCPRLLFRPSQAFPTVEYFLAQFLVPLPLLLPLPDSQGQRGRLLVTSRDSNTNPPLPTHLRHSPSRRHFGTPALGAGSASVGPPRS